MSLDLSEAEIDRILGWAKDHTSALRRHASWLKDGEGKVLPGAELAAAEVRKDIGADLELTLKIHDHRTALAASATETRKGGDA